MADPAMTGTRQALEAARDYDATADRHNLMRSIMSALAEHPMRAEICIQAPSGNPVEPREVWIEDLAAWARLDGTWVSLDLGRGAFKPTPNEQTRIRLAAEIWEAARAALAELNAEDLK